MAGTFSFAGVPSTVTRLLAHHRFEEAVEAAIDAGLRDTNHLSDLVFFACHPERCGRFIERDEPSFNRVSRHWLAIRDQLVNPILRGSTPTLPACSIPCAATFREFACLVRAVEQRSGLPPRDVLSLLRQVYYGDQSWSRTRTSVWNHVIPCGRRDISVERLGTQLINALHCSYLVQGVDVGHLFTGLEAMTCPTTVVTVPVGPTTYTVGMPNVEFATWGGDIGSAAAQKVWDEAATGRKQPLSRYVGGNGTLASDADLLGDIDSYGVRAGLLRGNRRSTVLLLSGQVSSVLDDYYSRSGQLSHARDRCAQVVAETLGARIVGARIVNKSEIVGPVSGRVQTFALAFFGLIARQQRRLRQPSAIKLNAASLEMSAWFLKWLETRMN